jgi:type I restriction enzyme, S subunit
MSKENKLIPELRFPEFVNDGEWELKPLIETADKNIKWSFTGGPFGSNLKASDYTTSGIRIIQLQNIGDGEFINEYKIYTSEDKADELLSCNIYSGDIIMSKMGDPVGRACIIPTDLKRCVMSSDGIRLVVNENNYSKYFIYSLINSKQIRERIEKKSTGSTRKRIGLNDLKQVQLSLPLKLQEQQKIAACLSSLDELIVAHNEKLEALKDHKKGLMQNLFPQEGEPVPKIRFSEFECDGEWVEKKLGDVYNFLVTNSFSRDKLNYKNGVVKNIHYGDIHTKFSTLFDIKREYVPFINPDVSVEKIREECYCIEGDIIFADASEDLNDVGKSLEIVNINGEMLVSGLHTLMARQINKVLEIGFGGYLFKSDSIRKQIKREAQGAKVLGISSGRISKIKISYPHNPIEQQKIASCLSAVDNLITAQQEKIEQLQQHKKGLMQGLFPKIEN